MTRQRTATLGMLAALAAVMLPGAEEEPPRLPADQPRRRQDGPPNRSREEARRRKQRARAGLPVVEPAPVDENACVGAAEGGGA